ncbi:MAG: hypothetical protein J3Q66DRAFT_349243 [Benniella sp.]|nr:MAG: hypothetical protein J3Q66DRAFT_349243 [Benniella sp.]
MDIPMVMNLDPKYPSAKVFWLAFKSLLISNVGVEISGLLSEIDPTNTEDENHPWYTIVLDNVMNAWVSDVTTAHFVSGIYASTWSRYLRSKTVLS